MIKEFLLLLLGFVVNFVIPPFVVAVVSYFIFPETNWNLFQITWVAGIWWLSLNYITINTQNTIKEELGE